MRDFLVQNLGNNEALVIPGPGKMIVTFRNHNVDQYALLCIQCLDILRLPDIKGQSS